MNPCIICGTDLDAPDHSARCLRFLKRLDRPERNVRRSDPKTSFWSAYEHPDSRQTDRARALRELVSSNGSGLTDYELGAQMGRQQNSAGKRRGELRDMGLVRDSGRVRPSPAKSRCIVWVADLDAIERERAARR